ncbi:MAG: hypothetical protein II453_15375, partial [Alphaproteobacteria bacterium]|nr:hypothetical protein [Alphaproteobacteria bacterium]
FIPDNFYYMYIDDYFADRRDCNIIDDKNFYDMFFYDVKQPRTIARREDGELLTFDYRPLNFEEFSALCKEEKRVIIKQSVNSSGGKGVAFYDAEHDPTSKLKDCLKNKNFIVQEVVNQHHELSKLHPESLNTIRIMTFFFEGKVHVLSAVVRMGVAGAKVDNASSGGIVCGINSDGTLKDRAFDTKANCYPVHPSSGVHFESVTIPNFNEFLELCKRLALRFINNTKLISWDFAVNSDGHPELIEVNLSYGEIDFHQMCNGSIFGPMTEKVIRYVFENNPRLKK